jgi:ATP-dependent Clp protease ATP-binding subunit ClpA
VIFFVRYGVSQTGHMTIESEHLLLGLVHEDGNILSRFVRDATLADVRDEITSRMAIKEKVPTSVDLPLSNESRRILAYAAEEAKRLNTDHIGPEHLLLGMLREETSTAAQVLCQHGLDLNAVRKDLANARMPMVECFPWVGGRPSSFRVALGVGKQQKASKYGGLFLFDYLGQLRTWTETSEILRS